MTPFRFGPAARQLYGVYHAAMPPRTGGDAVLICNPLGQEAVRFHRMQRVLADRLSSRGIAVLRFDYHGCGESSGEDEDADLAGWCDDLLLAHQELLRRSRAARISWLGVRLGASAAALASARAEPAPHRLLLWDPVLDGPACLAELAAAQARSLAEASGRASAATAAAIGGEALGFGIGAAMVEQIRALQPQRLDVARAGHAQLLGRAGDDALDTLAGRWRERGLPTRVVPIGQRFDWSSEEAMNTALVPAEVLDLLAAELEDGVHA
ncbi:MAG: alpha/beta hydrolase [Piscinibacter sp.]